MTMGDAISSFLERADQSTTNMCITSIEDIKFINRTGLGTRTRLTKWVGRRYKIKNGANRSRRNVIFLLSVVPYLDVGGRTLACLVDWVFAVAALLTANSIIVCISIVAGLLFHALSFMKTEQKSLRMLAQMDFGKVDIRGLIEYDIISVIGNVLVANSLEVFLSAVYFSYNSLFTCMLLGWERASYAHERKGLKVSAKPPKGAQRSSYFLSLSYRIALPLMVVSGLLHWLVLQNVFIAAIDVSCAYLVLCSLVDKRY